ncbi:unnamed protein product, partial [Ixodes pacificus]
MSLCHAAFLLPSVETSRGCVCVCVCRILKIYCFPGQGKFYQNWQVYIKVFIEGSIPHCTKIKQVLLSQQKNNMNVDFGGGWGGLGVCCVCCWSFKLAFRCEWCPSWVNHNYLLCMHLLVPSKVLLHRMSCVEAFYDL